MKFELGDALLQAAAAFSGAALSLRALPGATLVQRAGNLAAGVSIAAFVGAAVVEHMGIQSLRITLGISFVIGATGLVAFDAIIEALKKTDFVAWLTGWLPRRKGGE